VKKVVEIISAVVLLLMLLITIGQIVFRSILRISAAWSEELAMYTFAFIVFAGSVVLTKEEGHITITILIDKVPPAWQKALRVTARLVALPFMVLFSYGALRNTRSNWAYGLPTAEWMKIGYMYLVLFVSGTLTVYYLVANTVREFLPAKRQKGVTGGAA
jgi:TRAP-type C4-dicarboxylate transport system permease small subunit